MIPSLSSADLARLCPRADPRWAAALVALWPEICRLSELTSPRRARHFLSQTAEETGGFRVFQEDLQGYTALRLTQVWPRRFPTLAAAAPYARNAPALAEAVYGGRKDLGNTQPGDGWKYHGMGPLQATGRAWAVKLAAATGLDLVAHPELMLTPEVGWRSSAACWRLIGANTFADKDDLEGETRRINGGLTNLAERRRYLALANRLPMPMPPAPTPVSPARLTQETHMPDLLTILRPAITSALEAAIGAVVPAASAGPLVRSAGEIAAKAVDTVGTDPALAHVANAEPWYQSRVTLGALVSSAASLLGLVGLTLTPENRDAIVTLIVAVGGIVGPAVTLYGRWFAKLPLKA